MKLTERVVGTTNSAFSTGQGEGTCGEYPSWRHEFGEETTTSCTLLVKMSNVMTR